VTGRIITGSSINDCFVFLNLTQPIWAKSMDTPRMPSLSEGTASNKLLGHCVWRLSIPLPRTVTVPLGAGEMRPCRLPETFLERNTPVSVQYDLTISISRGMLRSDNRSVRLHFTLDVSFCLFCCIYAFMLFIRIRTAFGFIPSSRPDAPSILRQLAYQQFLPIPNPATDPDGWKFLRPVTVRGTLFRSHRIEAKAAVRLSTTRTL